MTKMLPPMYRSIRLSGATSTESRKACRVALLICRLPETSRLPRSRHVILSSCIAGKNDHRCLVNGKVVHLNMYGQCSDIVSSVHVAWSAIIRTLLDEALVHYMCVPDCFST